MYSAVAESYWSPDVFDPKVIEPSARWANIRAERILRSIGASDFEPEDGFDGKEDSEYEEARLWTLLEGKPRADYALSGHHESPAAASVSTDAINKAYEQSYPTAILLSVACTLIVLLLGIVIAGYGAVVSQQAVAAVGVGVVALAMTLFSILLGKAKRFRESGA